MIFPAKVGLALSLSCAPVCVLAAEDYAGTIAERAVVRPEGRLLGVKEGVTILSAAREHRRQVHSKPDCSHLVQQVYAMVGLEYPFASSGELYQGVESFERVAEPQPGDLIVWRGHVGLVVDPEAGTFYSSVRSGLKTESHRSPYWQRRGRPRFYRYWLVGNENSPVIAVNLGANPLDMLAIPDPAEDEPTRSTTKGELARLVSEDAVTVVQPTSLPEETVLISEGRELTRQAIARALIAYSHSANAQATPRPGSFIIFEQLRVDGLKVKGKQARARLELLAVAAVAGRNMTVNDERIKVSLDLRRTPEGWLLRMPKPVYLSRQAGVRVLAEHLAELARNDSLPQQQARLARVLNDLLNR